MIKWLMNKIFKKKCHYRACAYCDERKLRCQYKNMDEVIPNSIECKRFVDKTY